MADCTTYLTWRVDCSACGEITDTPDADDPPTECPECGEPCEVSL